MEIRKKQKIRKLFGSYLKARRESVLKIKSVRQLSFSSNLDYSKLTKIEKGLVDIRFDTLIELAITYKLSLGNLLDFNIDFWKEDED
jgi:DNA-binding Xre family transcriptional regulator